jgi:hypothetical protein
MTCHGLLYCVNLIVSLCTIPLAHVSLGCKISPMLTRVGWSIIWLSSRKNISQKKAGRTEVFYFLKNICVISDFAKLYHCRHVV